MTEKLSDIAFTTAVKAEQLRHGSRDSYARMDFRAGAQQLASFLAEVDTAYLCTANADGQPYAQHRGGKPGFIKVIDDETLGFADFKGNKQSRRAISPRTTRRSFSSWTTRAGGA